jgi:hypothetical protein
MTGPAIIFASVAGCRSQSSQATLSSNPAQLPMQTRELIFHGLKNFGWLWFNAAVCLIAAALIVLLLRYERRLISRPVGYVLLALRLSIVVLLFITFLQPVTIGIHEAEHTGRIIVALDISESMTTTDDFASEAELLQWARALGLIGNSTIAERLDLWIKSYERGEEPIWVTPDESVTDGQRSELARLRRDGVAEILATVRKLPRHEIARRLLSEGPQPLLRRLAELGTVELRTFAGESESIELTATGDAGSHATPDQALRSHSAAVAPSRTDLNHATITGTSDSGSTLIGVVILTDGRHNSGRDPIEAASRLGTLNVPVIPVMLGSTRRPRDVAIVSLDAPQVAFQHDTPMAQVRIAAGGYRNEELKIILERPDGTEETLVRRVPSETSGPPFVEIDFPLNASEPGRSNYAIHTEPLPDETRSDNNRREFSIEIVDDKASVLLVENEARWEFRFIDAALSRDDRVDLQQVVFGQPNLNLLPSTFFSSRLQLPAAPADVERSAMADLDMLIIGDVASATFTDAHWQVVEQYVREVGGTLILCAGKSHFPLGHHSPALLRLLPIHNLRVLDMNFGAATESPIERGFRLRITPDAERHAMFQFHADSIENRNIWNRLPGHLWGMPGEARPGASVLATAHRIDGPDLSDDRNHAIITHQYYGFGQVLWIGIDSTWRWRHRTGDRYHHRFWGQLSRWAARNKASAGNDFVRLSLDRHQIEVTETAVIQARWQDRFLELNPNLTARIVVMPEPSRPGQQPVATVELNPLEARPTIHEATLSGLTPGTWRLELQVDNAHLNELVETSLYVTEPQTGELYELSANRNLLTQMAEATGSPLLTPDTIASLPELLTPPTSITETQVERSLWDHWLTLTLFFALLTTEWVVRKLNGLP